MSFFHMPWFNRTNPSHEKCQTIKHSFGALKQVFDKETLKGFWLHRVLSAEDSLFVFGFLAPRMRRYYGTLGIGGDGRPKYYVMAEYTVAGLPKWNAEVEWQHPYNVTSKDVIFHLPEHPEIGWGMLDNVFIGFFDLLKPGAVLFWSLQVCQAFDDGVLLMDPQVQSRGPGY